MVSSALGNEVPSELPPQLADVLRALDYAGSSGLLTAADPSEVSSRDYYWRDLRDKVGLDAVFFSDGVPIVGFTSKNDATGLARVRRRLWNYGRVPLLINAGDESVTAFDAASSVPRTDDEATNDRLADSRVEQISTQLLRVFNRREVESGKFDFRMRGSDRRRRVTRVDSVLLRNLSELKSRASVNSPARRDEFETLVGGCLTASYLRDRGILSADHLRELSGLDELDEVLMSGIGSTSRLFDGLAERFNGDVFGAIPESLANLSDEDTAGIAGMLRGDDLTSGQLSLWPYDFSVLPADLVSSVYEELLSDTRVRDSAYYTPRFLVDLVLDEIIPWDREAVESAIIPTVADIACGSGAFMIEAFRRISYFEQARSSEQLTYEQLNELLTSHIYGIDQNPAAARVAAFGLYLSVLERVDPPDIWNQVRLPQLIGQNIIVGDAFDQHELRDRAFDIVVSNPPWMSRLTPDARSFVAEKSVPIADNQIAQAFVWLARDLLRPGGTLGLVLPSKPLLHNRGAKAVEFREALFSGLTVSSIVDLSPIRREIFSAAVAPSAIFIARSHDSTAAEPGEDSEILHLAAHPSHGSSPIDALVISPEDIHMVPVAQARVRPDIWKVLLWGSERDLQLLDKLRRRFPAVDKLAAEREWTVGQGFQVGGGDERDASSLYGLPIIQTDSVGFLRLNETIDETAEWTTLHRPRTRTLYRAPLAVIRRTIRNGEIAAAAVTEDAVFPNGCVGVSGKPGDLGTLEFFCAATVSSLGRYWHFLTSSSWGVERDFVELNEFLSLPLPQPTPEHVDNLRTLTARVNEEGATSELRQLVDELVFDVYRLNRRDRDRILDRMSTALGRFYGQSDNSDDLERVQSYRDLLTSTLRSTLPSISVQTDAQDDGKYRAVAVTLRPRIQEGELGARPAIPAVNVELLLSQLARGSDNPTAVIAQPSGFFIDEDTVFLIKTTDPHRWSDDSALDDAGRIVAALTDGV